MRRILGEQIWAGLIFAEKKLEPLIRLRRTGTLLNQIKKELY
jgi:hypothetical protein